MRTVVRNGTVLDTTTMTYSEGQTVVMEDGIIVEVRDSRPADGTTGSTGTDIGVDAADRFVLPGLIDGHVHFRLTTLDFRSLTMWSEVEFGIAMATLARGTLERGFTTVRDLGGDVSGLIRAIERGAARGPRIVRAGLMLTQTGGHGDSQGGERPVPECGCAMGSDAFSIIADGVDAVRKGARYLLRDGSDFLKIHVSGGVASPSDPLESLQYTPDEVRAAVTEARNRGTYVAAHAYTPEAIAMAVDEGVHTIEHGNLVDDATAELLAASDAVLVPTLVTYKAMHEVGERFGLPQTSLEKNVVIYESGLSSLERLVAAGVTLGLGTDLIGETQPMQNQELAIRAEVQPPADVLRSMWMINAQLCRLEGRVGVIAPDAFADLVISRVDPLEELAGFADSQTSLSHVIQAGQIVVDRS